MRARVRGGVVDVEREGGGVLEQAELRAHRRLAPRDLLAHLSDAAREVVVLLAQAREGGLDVVELVLLA